MCIRAFAINRVLWTEVSNLGLKRTKIDLLKNFILKAVKNASLLAFVSSNETSVKNTNIADIQASDFHKKKVSTIVFQIPVRISGAGSGFGMCIIYVLIN